MRGEHRRQETMFGYVAPEARVPKRHPLRPIRAMVDQALAVLDAEFEALYSHTGRPSIPPEYLLRATLLQILCPVRSERLLVEQIDYNRLFRWFIGLSMDDLIWDHSTFTKNRDRLLEANIARRFFREVVDQARGAKLLSDEHFSVDGTLIQAWASMKRFRPKDGSGSGPGPGRNSERDFQDPEARLYRKSRGQGAQLCYQSHILMENRDGLIVDHELTPASGTGERKAAVDMVTRLSAIDGRTTRHPGYIASQRIRKRIEETFGWGKIVGPLRQVKIRRVAKIDHLCLLTYAAYNLVRMRNLVGGRAMTLGPWCARNPPKGRSGAQKGPKTGSRRLFRTPIEPNGAAHPFTKHETTRFHENFNGLLKWSAKSYRGPNGGSTEQMGTGDPLPLPASWGKGKTLDQAGKWNILEGPSTGVA